MSATRCPTGETDEDLSFHPPRMKRDAQSSSKLNAVDREETHDALAEAIRTGRDHRRGVDHARLRGALVCLEVVGGRGPRRSPSSAQPLPILVLARGSSPRGSLRSTAVSAAAPAPTRG